MAFPEFTTDHYARMQDVTRDYIRERSLHLSPLTGNGDQLNFMRMCNTFAEKLEKVMPLMGFDDLESLYISMDAGINYTPLGVPADFPNFTPLDRGSCAELLGCLLGLRRMASGQ